MAQGHVPVQHLASFTKRVNFSGHSVNTKSLGVYLSPYASICSKSKTMLTSFREGSYISSTIEKKEVGPMLVGAMDVYFLATLWFRNIEVKACLIWLLGLIGYMCLSGVHPRYPSKPRPQENMLTILGATINIIFFLGGGL